VSERRGRDGIGMVVVHLGVLRHVRGRHRVASFLSGGGCECVGVWVWVRVSGWVVVDRLEMKF